MREVGRRGSTNLMYEVVISLILLALFVATAYLYIDANARGEQYYSQFYAADLGTTADLVVAGNGDVLLRYDNLKPSLDITFWLTNGKVAVAKTPLPGVLNAITPAKATTTKTLSMAEPFTAAKQRYGPAQDYPLPELLTKPLFLSLRKVEESFSITEADTILSVCPASTPRVPLSDARVWFTAEGITGEESTRAQNAFAATLPKGIARASAADKATVTITVARATGTDALTVQPTSADGQQFACLYWRTLGLLSLHEWEQPKPQAAGDAFTVRITVTTGKDTTVTPEHLGQAAALALARMYG